MNKIRINELARELEVKAHEILDRLPELGVAEKKTHSSSIDEDVAIKLRRLLGGAVFEESAEPESHAPEPPERVAAPVPAPPVLEASSTGPVSQAAAPAVVEEKAPEPAAAKTVLERPAGRPAQPIRPPLAGGSPSTVAPIAPPPPAPPRAAPPPAPPAAVIAPGRPIPPAARPVPPARPGQ